MPFNLLYPKLSSFRKERLPRKDGILPLNWLLFKNKYLSLSRLPNDGGNVPFKLLFARSIQYTFVLSPSPRISRCTPYHVPSGCLVNQLAAFVQCGPSVLLYKSTNARESWISTWAFVMEGVINKKTASNKRSIRFVFIRKVF